MTSKPPRRHCGNASAKTRTPKSRRLATPNTTTASAREAGIFHVALLIAIEGIDGSGKGTQSALLVEHLRQQGHRACLLSFPRYEHTRFGAAIGDFLNGQFGDLHSVHPQLAALLFAGDRFESKDVIFKAAADHDVVVFDRYVASNIAHQAAKLDGPQRLQLIQWIESIEYEVYGLPHPHLTVLLDLPARAAQSLIAAKAQRSYTDKPADLQEADGAYLERVRQVYRSLAEQRAEWAIIDCVRNEAIRPIEDIAEELQGLVDRRIKNQRSDAAAGFTRHPHQSSGEC